MTSPSPLREFFRQALFENVGLKLISLVCAIGFYAFIHGAERAQRTFPVPVVVLMPPDSANRQLIKAPPTEIAITLSGPKTQIDSLSGNDLGTVQLDLRTGHESSVAIKPTMFNVPPNLSVEQIFPTQIDVRWDDVVTRRLPVQVARTGEPAAGLAVTGSVTTRPETVEARGPRAVIEVMQYARAAAFDVTGLAEGTHPRSLLLDPPPKQVSYDVDSVTATVEISREERMVPFKALKIEVVGAPRATTRPPTVNVKVRGTPDVVNSLQPESIVPRVELPQGTDLTKPGSMIVPVVIDVTGVQTEVDPPRVLVKW